MDFLDDPVVQSQLQKRKTGGGSNNWADPGARTAAIDFEAIANKYGRDSNWNTLRGSDDPLLAGLDPGGNWNSYRPAAPRDEDAPPPAPSPTPQPSPQPQPGAPSQPYNPLPPSQWSTPPWGPGPMNGSYSHTDAKGRRVYKRPDGSLWMDDPDPNTTWGYVPYDGGSGGGGNPSDPNYIRSTVEKWMRESNPYGHRDVDYWIQRINENGGFGGQYNEQYWLRRFMEDPNNNPHTAGGAGGTGGTTTGIPGVPVSSYAAQFDDPSTRHLEDWMTARLNELRQPINDPSREALARLLDEQTRMYQQQRAQFDAEQAALKERRGRARTSADEYINFAKERATKLQGPAYTGAEGEVLRTQALDPIEADRQAARQRALQQISNRGMDPTSGVAQQLLNDVDASFDRTRAASQNTVAYRQIAEQRSREEEAQNILQSIPGAEEAVLRGDMDFIQALNSILNQSQQGAIMSAGQSAALGERVRSEEQTRRQEALAIASLLQELPTHALQQSMAAIGGAPSPESLSNMAIQLYQVGQQNRNQGMGWYETLGSALPYLTKMGGTGFGGGGGWGGSNNFGGDAWMHH